MEIIKEELNKVKSIMLKGFEDPFKGEELLSFLNGPSKMIRSSLALLYLKAQNVIITEDIYKILAAAELIHNASLLHDDVIDNADTRRGVKVLAKSFTPDISILAGDYILTYAIEKLSGFNTEIISLFKNCAKNMTEAEIKQYCVRNSKPDIDTYIEICKGKTAGLFSAVMEASAIISSLNKQNAKMFGEIFGIIFQIKNDLEEKSAIEDNKNGINTAKDIIGIENTLSLLDNYRGEIKSILAELPNNEYKRALEDLI